MVPKFVTAIANDWIMKNHGYNEDEVKAAMFAHNLYED